VALWLNNDRFAYMWDHNSPETAQPKALELFQVIWLDVLLYGFGFGSRDLKAAREKNSGLTLIEASDSPTPDGLIVLNKLRATDGGTKLVGQLTVDPQKGFLITRSTTLNAEGNISRETVVVPA
jgi:hypothetical protein